LCPRTGSRRLAESLACIVGQPALLERDAIRAGLLDASGSGAARVASAGIEQILLAAYETTTMMLARALDLLARHPRWQKPCAAEEVAGRVVSEALRHFPPTWLFLRVAAADDRLPSGAGVPAGCKSGLTPYVSQRTSTAFGESRLGRSRSFPAGARRRSMVLLSLRSGWAELPGPSAARGPSGEAAA